MTIKKIIVFWGSICLVLALVVLPCLTGCAAEEGALPSTVSFATYPSGWAGNVVGAAFAQIITTYTPMSVDYKPMAGTTVWAPMINRGEIDMGFDKTCDAPRAYKGTLEYTYPHTNYRLLFGAHRLLAVQICVREDSDIYKIGDLRGKRVTSDFTANAVVEMEMMCALASGGLTYDDVIKVPVTDMSDSLQALRDGRVDACYAAGPTIAGAVELDAAIGIRFISNEDENLLQKALDELLPGCTPGVIKAGTGILEEDVLGFWLPFVVTTSTHLSEDAAYEIVKAIWEHEEIVRGSHVCAADWSHDDMCLKPTIPYHPGAIRFYKEMGVWTEEFEKLNEELLEAQ